MPTSSGTKENASGTALPTRSFSAVFAWLASGAWMTASVNAAAKATALRVSAVM